MDANSCDGTMCIGACGPVQVNKNVEVKGVVDWLAVKKKIIRTADGWRVSSREGVV
jgi:hypothetical protein